MALAHMPPLPPELAMDDSPLPDAELAQLWDAATELAADAAMEVADATLQLADSDDGPSRRWWITDDGGAEWALRHVAEAEQALAQLQAQRDAWQARIDGWFRQAAGKEHARRAFFVDHLERYAEAEREKGRKTVQLPSGTLRTRPQPAKVVVQNPAAVLNWADELGLLDEVAPPERKPKLTPLREHAKVVRVVDHARLLLHDGQVAHWFRAPFGPADFMLDDDGSVWLLDGASPCPAIGDGSYRQAQADGTEHPVDLPALVAQLVVEASHLEVHGPDGNPVPGCYAEPEGISASIALATDGQ